MSGQTVSSSFEPWVVRLNSNTTLNLFLFLCSLHNDVIHTFSTVLVGMKTRNKVFPRVRRELIRMIRHVSRDIE